MTQEEKQLLLRDLCARLPYGVKANVTYFDWQHDEKIKKCDTDITYGNIYEVVNNWNDCKPYLRPMSSMTEEEIEFMGENGFRVYKKTNCFDNNCDVYDDGWDNFYVDKQSFEGVIELFYSHHFDYRGLIEKGLALEAPEGMYKTK